MAGQRGKTLGRNWTTIIAEANRIARSYSTPVTLRQLHYRLAVTGFGGYRNNKYDYQHLSKLTAEARRNGTFPQLLDTTRGVRRPNAFRSVASVVNAVAQQYRRNRTEGQKRQVWVILEKATLAQQVIVWTREYGIPVAALRGYSSESLEREIFEQMDSDGRPAIVFYIGDLDPEGEDIPRNFQAQAARMGIEFESWTRLAVLFEQIAEFGLIEQPPKDGSSVSARFEEVHGRAFQIEAEAIPPDALQRLVEGAVLHRSVFNRAQWTRMVNQERDERAQLRAIARGVAA